MEQAPGQSHTDEFWSTAWGTGVQSFWDISLVLGNWGVEEAASPLSSSRALAIRSPVSAIEDSKRTSQLTAAGSLCLAVCAMFPFIRHRLHVSVVYKCRWVRDAVFLPGYCPQTQNSNDALERDCQRSSQRGVLLNSVPPFVLLWWMVETQSESSVSHVWTLDPQLIDMFGGLNGGSRDVGVSLWRF